MKHQEFYKKYAVSNSPGDGPILSGRTWWNVLAALVAILVEPFIFYGRHHLAIPFSFAFYVRVVEVSLLIVCLLAVVIVLFSWRDWVTKLKGYGWVGTFEVQRKHQSYWFYYLGLAPGNNNTIKVSRSLFETVRIGDFVEVKRDALGKVDSVMRTGNFSSRLKKYY